MIPYGRQGINEEDIQAVVNVLRSDWLTQGPSLERFEQEIISYCGAQYGVAVCNATAALHLACLALDVGPGDIVWTSPNTFVASANCALYCGASVDFVDIDPRTYNMSVEALHEKLMRAEAHGRIPKVVIPVHFAGQACVMRDIHALAQKYGFKVIEDASHAIGGRYLGEPIGLGRFSDITIFSFHPVKIITTGEGGFALTNNLLLAERMRLFRSHGITREVANADGAWSYCQIELGYNYRMTDMQAALGASQMSRLDAFVARRHEIAQYYQNALADVSIILPWQHPDGISSYHLYPVQVLGRSRAVVFDTMRAAGIGVNVHYIPVHTQPYYQQLGFKVGDFPEAEHYYQRTISLPMFPTLTREQQDFVISTLKEALG